MAGRPGAPQWPRRALRAAGVSGRAAGRECARQRSAWHGICPGPGHRVGLPGRATRPGGGGALALAGHPFVRQVSGAGLPEKRASGGSAPLGIASVRGRATSLATSLKVGLPGRATSPAVRKHLHCNCRLAGHARCTPMCSSCSCQWQGCLKRAGTRSAPLQVERGQWSRICPGPGLQGRATR